MFAEERHQKIEEIIAKEKSITVERLSTLLGVSAVTVRKDLDYLARKGALSRTFGGAIRHTGGLRHEQPYESKEHTMVVEKKQVAEQAAQVVEDHMVVLIDAGSTAAQLCPFIQQHSGLTVITYNLQAALALCSYPHISLIFIGGEVSASSKSCTGAEVLHRLHDYYVDIAFIGCDGFDLQHGAFTTSPKRSYIKQQAMEHAGKTVLLTTSDKYQVSSLIHFANLEVFDYIFLDSGNTVLNKELAATNLAYYLTKER